MNTTYRTCVIMAAAASDDGTLEDLILRIASLGNSGESTALENDTTLSPRDRRPISLVKADAPKPSTLIGLADLNELLGTLSKYESIKAKFERSKSEYLESFDRDPSGGNKTTIEKKISELIDNIHAGLKQEKKIEKLIEISKEEWYQFYYEDDDTKKLEDLLLKMDVDWIIKDAELDPFVKRADTKKINDVSYRNCLSVCNDMGKYEHFKNKADPLFQNKIKVEYENYVKQNVNKNVSQTGIKLLSALSALDTSLAKLIKIEEARGDVLHRVTAIYTRINMLFKNVGESTIDTLPLHVENLVKYIDELQAYMYRYVEYSKAIERAGADIEKEKQLAWDETTAQAQIEEMSKRIPNDLSNITLANETLVKLDSMTMMKEKYQSLMNAIILDYTQNKTLSNKIINDKRLLDEVVNEINANLFVYNHSKILLGEAKQEWYKFFYGENDKKRLIELKKGVENNATWIKEEELKSYDKKLENSIINKNSYEYFTNTFLKNIPDHSSVKRIKGEYKKMMIQKNTVSIIPLGEKIHEKVIEYGQTFMELNSPKYVTTKHMIPLNYNELDTIDNQVANSPLESVISNIEKYINYGKLIQQYHDQLILYTEQRAQLGIRTPMVASDFPWETSTRTKILAAMSEKLENNKKVDAITAELDDMDIAAGVNAVAAIAKADPSSANVERLESQYMAAQMSKPKNAMEVLRFHKFEPAYENLPNTNFSVAVVAYEELTNYYDTIKNSSGNVMPLVKYYNDIMTLAVIFNELPISNLFVLKKEVTALNLYDYVLYMENILTQKGVSYTHVEPFDGTYGMTEEELKRMRDKGQISAAEERLQRQIGKTQAKQKADALEEHLQNVTDENKHVKNLIRLIQNGGLVTDEMKTGLSDSSIQKLDRAQKEYDDKEEDKKRRDDLNEKIRAAKSQIDKYKTVLAFATKYRLDLASIDLRDAMVGFTEEQINAILDEQNKLIDKKENKLDRDNHRELIKQFKDEINRMKQAVRLAEKYGTLEAMLSRVPQQEPSVSSEQAASAESLLQASSAVGASVLKNAKDVRRGAGKFPKKKRDKKSKGSVSSKHTTPSTVSDYPAPSHDPSQDFMDSQAIPDDLHTDEHPEDEAAMKRRVAQEEEAEAQVAGIPQDDDMPPPAAGSEEEEEKEAAEEAEVGGAGIPQDYTNEQDNSGVQQDGDTPPPAAASEEEEAATEETELSQDNPDEQGNNNTSEAEEPEPEAIQGENIHGTTSVGEPTTSTLPIQRQSGAGKKPASKKTKGIKTFFKEVFGARAFEDESSGQNIPSTFSELYELLYGKEKGDVQKFYQQKHDRCLVSEYIIMNAFLKVSTVGNFISEKYGLMDHSIETYQSNSHKDNRIQYCQHSTLVDIVNRILDQYEYPFVNKFISMMKTAKKITKATFFYIYYNILRMYILKQQVLDNMYDIPNAYYHYINSIPWGDYHADQCLTNMYEDDKLFTDKCSYVAKLEQCVNIHSELIHTHKKIDRLEELQHILKLPIHIGSQIEKVTEHTEDVTKNISEEKENKLGDYKLAYSNLSESLKSEKRYRFSEPVKRITTDYLLVEYMYHYSEMMCIHLFLDPSPDMKTVSNLGDAFYHCAYHRA